MKFDYRSIPGGYYFRAMESGCAPQRFWHRQKFLRVLEAIPRSCHEVLDVGCAAGSLTYLAAAARPELQITGVDISRAQIRFACENVLPFSPHAVFQEVPNGALPFPNASFDAIVSVELIEHLSAKECQRLAAEIARILRPGGKWILTTPNYASLWPLLEVMLNILSPVKYTEQHISKFRPDSLVRCLKSLGFSVSTLDTFFVFSPFCSWISDRLAHAVLALEKVLRLPGSLIIVTVTALE